MALYRVSLYNPQGTIAIQIDDWTSIEAAYSVNAIGAVVLSLPPRYPLSLLRRDSRLWIERQAVTGGMWKTLGERLWLLRRKGLKLSQSGEYSLRVVAYDANYILDAPIVAYAAGTDFSDKSEAADDMMKAIIRENLGGLATDTARDLSAYITVAANNSSAPVIDKGFAWQNVLKVLQDIAKTSAQLGTYLAFDLVATNPSSLIFKTYINQRGVDRRHPETSSVTRPSVTLGAENLASIEYDFDATNERTYAYAGGAGEEADRLIAEASDETRMAISPFNRREVFRDVRNIDDEAQLEDEAEAAVRAGLPVETYSGVYVESNKIFGKDFDFGDYVTVDLRNTGMTTFTGPTVDCRIDTVKIVASQGDEKIDLKFRSEGVTL